MTSFYYYDQNPLGFCFFTKFKYERKNVKDSGLSSKMTPSWNGLFVKVDKAHEEFINK